MTMWCDLEALNLGESICPGAFWGPGDATKASIFWGQTLLQSTKCINYQTARKLCLSHHFFKRLEWNFNSLITA